MFKFLFRRIMVGDKLPDLLLPIFYQNSLQNMPIHALFPNSPYILLGHPGAFTSYSTKEQIPEFKQANFSVPVVLWSVNDPFVIKKYAQKYEVPFTVICDYNGELTRSLDLGLNEEEYFSFACKRTLCIIKESVVLGVSSELNVMYTEATKPQMVTHLLNVIL